MEWCCGRQYLGVWDVCECGLFRCGGWEVGTILMRYLDRGGVFRLLLIERGVLLITCECDYGCYGYLATYVSH